MPIDFAASSMLRWVRRAAMASSLLRVNFEPGPAIHYQPLPFIPHSSGCTIEFLQNPLACVPNRSDQCADRGGRRDRSTKMKAFTIENETNNITLHATIQDAEAVADAEHFRNEAALAKLAANWPAARLVDI